VSRALLLLLDLMRRRKMKMM